MPVAHQIGDVPAHNERMVLKQWTGSVGERGRWKSSRVMGGGINSRRYQSIGGGWCLRS